MKNKSLGLARPAIFSTVVFGKNDFKILFLKVLALSLNSGRAGSSLLGTADSGQSISANNIFRAGDVLFGKLRPRLRKSVQAQFDGYCSTDILVLRPTAEVAPIFVGFVLQSDAVFGEAIRTEEGTKMPRCSWGTLKNLRVYCPKHRHQQRIAEILSTVDEAIEQTEALIAKTEQIKAGLMHDLFTRGVTGDGQLRPPREEAPQLYKESPLGWVPNHWTVVALGKVVPRTVYGISAPLDAGPGVPVLRMNNIRDGGVEISDLKFSRSPLALALRLCRGDVLFNRTNSIDHVGRTGIWRGELIESSFASYLVRLDPDPDRLRSEFLNAWLNWETTQIRIRSFATPGVHQVNINPTNLRRAEIAVPARLEEQDAVVRVLESNAETLREYIADVEKLKQMKQGLMRDLLTGRVPVVIDTAPNAKVVGGS